jgi:hypothetical protein
VEADAQVGVRMARLEENLAQEAYAQAQEVRIFRILW